MNEFKGKGKLLLAAVIIAVRIKCTLKKNRPYMLCVRKQRIPHTLCQELRLKAHIGAKICERLTKGALVRFILFQKLLHWFFSAASTVFFNSIAIVMGPTPPGTGVI